MESNDDDEQSIRADEEELNRIERSIHIRHFCRQAEAGDQSFASVAIGLFQKELKSASGLTPELVAFVNGGLDRVLESSEALNTFCGVSSKRGTPKRGLRKYEVGFAVLREALVTNDSMELIWQRVAAKMNLADGTVKAYWTAWRQENDPENGIAEFRSRNKTA